MAKSVPFFKFRCTLKTVEMLLLFIKAFHLSGVFTDAVAVGVQAVSLLYASAELIHPRLCIKDKSGTSWNLLLTKLVFF